jgi:biotin carboxylase
MTILCLASYEKGQRFITECKRQGATVVLITSLSLKDKAHWPLDDIEEVYYMPDHEGQWERQDLLNAVTYLGRTRVFDRIVGLDDFDVETAAMLREHLRVMGSGETTARFYRDKLAMRVKARDAGIPVPDFRHVLNYDRLREFMDRVPGPWVLKPRSMAGAIGIKKIHTQDEFWNIASQLGNMQSQYLLERFVPGDIFHVDSTIFDGEVRFAIASGYGKPPMEVSHHGGVFTSRILDRDSALAADLLHSNERVMKTFGMRRGVSHTEFIQGADGQIYFLETSARVGGAHVSDLIEAATGLNLWEEWARLEVAENDYPTPKTQRDYAGLLVTLARQQRPDTSAYNDPEVVWRMDREHHAGLIVKSASVQRVEQLMREYSVRMLQDFGAFMAPRDRPTS